MEAIITTRNVVAAPVRDSVHGGGCLPDTPLGRHPPGQTPPGRHPLGRPPTQETATAADGKHPNGMRSCSY